MEDLNLTPEPFKLSIKAADEGRKAFLDGKYSTENPYDFYDSLYGSWRTGWDQEKEKSLEFKPKILGYIDLGKLKRK